MGVNGQNQSLSIITFNLDAEPIAPATSELQGVGYPCDYPVAEDGVLDGYTDITNSTCSYCQGSCSAPAVDDKIGFLDGLSWKKVGYSYGFFIVFTILFQVIVHFACTRKGSGLVDPETQKPVSGKLNNTNTTSGDLSAQHNTLVDFTNQ